MEKNTGSKNVYKVNFNYDSGISDLTAKIDFDYTPVPAHTVRFGTEYVRHTYIPETYSSVEYESEAGKVLADSTYSNKGHANRTGNELSAYAEDDFNLGEKLTMNPGIHLAMFSINGKFYISPEPRMSAKYDLGKDFSVKAAYSRMAQYVHLLSSAQITLPIDLWVPITKKIKPVTSDQVSAGLYYTGFEGWDLSVEGYWKYMDNVLEYKDGVSFLANSQAWEDNVIMGSGRAFGIELFIQKTIGSTTGWLGYTLAKSDRIFSDGSINNGERFPYRYDRRHNISLVVNHQFGKIFDVSGTWTFATGGTTTLPEREIPVENPDGTVTQVDYSPSRNNYRLPPSHRLNIAFNCHKYGRRGESIWNISVYNIYDRMNPNFVFSSAEYVYPSGSKVYVRDEKLTSLTILPIIPSFGYTYKF